MQKTSSVPRLEISTAGGYKRLYSLSNLEYSIGSNLEADICHPELAPGHAHLRFDFGEWVLTKDNRNAQMTFRDFPIEMKKLNPGDSIGLGNVFLSFLGLPADTKTAETLLDAESGKMGRFVLKIIRGPDKGKTYHLRPGEYVMGRPSEQKDSRIEIADPFLSRDHARLFVEKSRIIVEDLKSTNGTRIGWRRIQRAELKFPGKLKIGRSVIEIQFQSSSRNHTTDTQIITNPNKTLKRRILIAAAIVLAIASIACVLILKNS
jgi:hypothetical protein